MINLILLTLSLANPKPVQTAQFRPCVWPNTCKTFSAPAPAPAPVLELKPVQVAQFTTCVMPKKCGKQA